uniref:Copine C-terminal domain-containing protein n=1 Tax=Ananas comosus var. bracteatus TaxID=296719 RepID=A0A6V7P757_ANACO|nr:unnamed protein product [Ananas comosus var. bracteatus]
MPPLDSCEGGDPAAIDCFACHGHAPNPYDQAISIIARTLAQFDADNLIPCFESGDLYYTAASTHDQEMFSFYPDDRPCDGFEDPLLRYREIVPHLPLAGPTYFAPIIELQKIEMKIQMGHRNGQRKAMVIAAEKNGIDSIAVDGDMLVVTGVGVDLVKLVKSLRKKIGCTQIVTVSEVKKDKEEKPLTIPYWYSYSHLPPMYAMYDAPAPDHPCSIM